MGGRGAVSQVENGHMRLSEKRLESWCQAVHMDRKYFAKRLLAYYEPKLFEMIFGGEDD